MLGSRRRLSECPSCKSGLCMCLPRATSRHICFSLGKRRDHIGRHRQYPAFDPTKSLHNLCFIWSSLAELPVILWYILKNPNKKFPRYRRCAAYGSDPIPEEDFVSHSIIGMFSQGTFRVTWFESSFRASEAGHVPLSENVRIILV